MAYIVANYAISTRKDDAKYYGKGGTEGNIFNPFNDRVADPDKQDIVRITNDNNLYVHFTWIFKQG